MRTLKKALCLVLCLVMVLGLCVFSVSAKDNFAGYTDANQLEEDYAEAVDVLIGLGVVEGMDATTLNLNGNYTRAQAAKITAYVALGPTAAANLKCSEAPFTDVGVDHWAAGYIAYCAEHGILDGMGDGTFAPEATLTGYQFGKMMLCVVGYGQQGEYKDVGWEINVAKDGVRKNIYKDVLSAATNEPITRQQAMQMAFNTLTKVGVVKYSGLINDYVNAQASTNDVITGKSVDDSLLRYDNYPNCYTTYGRVDWNSTDGWNIDGVPVAEAGYKDYGKNAHIWYKSTSKGYEALTTYYVDDVELGSSNDGTTYSDLTTRGNSSFLTEADSWIEAYSQNAYIGSADTIVVDGVDKIALPRGAQITFYDDASIGLNGKADTAIVMTKSVAVLNSAPAYSKDGTKFTLSAHYPKNSKSSVWNGQQAVADFTGLDGLAADDVVLFFEDAAGVTHIQKAQSKVDKLVRYTGTVTDAKVWLHSATSDYQISLLPTVTDGNKLATQIINELIGVNANFYFDDFGNIVWWSVIEAESRDYAVLLDYGYNPGGTSHYAVNTEDVTYDMYAKLLKSDGEQVKVVVKNIYDGDDKYEDIYVVSGDTIHWATGDDGGTSLSDGGEKKFNVDQFYTYTVNSDGSYNLRRVTDQVIGSGSVKNGVSAITVTDDSESSTTVYGNYDTVYLFKYENDDGKTVYGRSVSVRNAPTTDESSDRYVAAVKDDSGTATYVYAYDAKGESSSNTYFFLGLLGVQVDDKNTDLNEKAYVYRAVKDGELVDVYLATNTTVISDATNYQGFCDVKLTTDSKRPAGYAESINPVTDEGVLSTSSTVSVRYDKHGYVRSGSDAYTFTDDVKVYVLNTNSKGEWTLDVGGTEIITEDVNDLVWVKSNAASTPLHVKEFYIVKKGDPVFAKGSDNESIVPKTDNDNAASTVISSADYTVTYEYVDANGEVVTNTTGSDLTAGDTITVRVHHKGSEAELLQNITLK